MSSSSETGAVEPVAAGREGARPLRVLMVEDNPGDARLVSIMLAESPVAFEAREARRLDEALTLLAAENFDVALLDLGLPDSLGLDTLRRVMVAAPSLPIVILTGNADDRMAMEALEQGAQDYLVKGWGGAEALQRAIRYAIERGRTEEKLKQSESMFRAIFEQAALGISLFDAELKLVAVNNAIERTLGYESGKLLGQTAIGFTYADDVAVTERLTQDLMAGKCDHATQEKRYIKADGSVIWGRMTLSPVRDSLGQVKMGLAIVENIDERKKLEERMRLDARVIAAASEGVFVTDSHRVILQVNPAFSRITGYESHEAVGQTPNLLTSGRHSREFFDRIEAALASAGAWQGEIWNRRKSGEVFPCWLDISVVRNDQDAIVNYVAVFHDITARKQNEERLTFMANHDPLTGLANRILYDERIERALARARRAGLKVALLFLDLDGFKFINERFGHPVGDVLLQRLAERLTLCVRQGDTVARISGDEFLLIVEDIDDFRIAATVARKALDTLKVPFQVEEHAIKLDGSIGIALYPEDGLEAAQLYKAADSAMYKAKRMGGNDARFHCEELNGRAIERLVMERKLAEALDHDEIDVFYQPVVLLPEGRVAAAEALVRWRRSDGKLDQPGDFLEVVRQSGMMPALAGRVAERAFHDAAAWRQAGHDVGLILNLGEEELLVEGFAASFLKALTLAKLEPSALEIDLAEATIEAAGQKGGKVLEELKAMGVRMALDNFGSGFSSIAQLGRLPVECFKIDHTFLRDVKEPGDEAKMVAAIIGLTRSLKRKVVAKGVENEAQKGFLIRQGCEMAQGYLLGRPMPGPEFLDFLKSGK
ncbi:MAG: EAL domain-containing protein [Rhodospirillales bacterium]|jgi:diguanylate cyclase (GGDEF)-like protein/PAS domain S-box-containing protein